MVSALFAIASSSSHAQDYKTGIGLRLGGLSSGISVKGFVNSTAAIEGIASFAHRSFILTGLYEVHRDIPNAEGLKWFYGGGAHLGFFRYGGYYHVYKYRGDLIYVSDEGDNRVVPGIDFILGLDYKFTNAPVNLGLDIKPFIDFADGFNGYWDGALSFRFVF
jgi:hypothetical protein